jgi:hypothetical protein
MSGPNAWFEQRLAEYGTYTFLNCPALWYWIF